MKLFWGQTASVAAFHFRDVEIYYAKDHNEWLRLRAVTDQRYFDNFLNTSVYKRSS